MTAADAFIADIALRAKLEDWKEAALDDYQRGLPHTSVAFDQTLHQLLNEIQEHHNQGRAVLSIRMDRTHDVIAEITNAADAPVIEYRRTAGGKIQYLSLLRVERLEVIA